MSEEGKQPEDPAAVGNPNTTAEEELRAAEEELAAARAAVAAAEERVAQARYAAAYPPPAGPAVGGSQAGPLPNQQPVSGAQAIPGAQVAADTQAPDVQAAPNMQSADAQSADAQAASSQSGGPQQDGSQQYRPPVQPHYAAQAPSRDHVAAGLLAIFLGGFGVHKFYLGYSTQGFITLAVFLLGGLLSFGIVSSIMWIIAIVEGIIYLSKSQSEFERIYVYGKREWF